MDIYVVTDGQRVVSASTKLQGAELIRITEAQRLFDDPASHVHTVEDYYDRMTVTNIELQDLDD